MLRSKAGEASPIASRMTSPPALRIVIISNALRVFDSARTDSAATMKAVSVPLIQNSSQPSCAGARFGRRREPRRSPGRERLRRRDHTPFGLLAVDNLRHLELSDAPATER